MLLETCCSRTDDYLSTKRTLEEATSEVERVRKVRVTGFDGAGLPAAHK